MPTPDATTAKPMIITQNVIQDLVPLYFDGEASADSRALIEKWFASEPDFARTARKQSEAISSLATADTTPISDESVRISLRRAHRIILAREVSLGLAGALSLFFIAVAAFLVLSPVSRLSGAGFAMAICFLLAAMNWAIYFTVRRQTGPGLP